MKKTVDLELLKKYMRHVDWEEGLTFVITLNEHPIKFTDEEVEILKELNKEIQDED